MNADKHFLYITEQLKSAESNEQVEKIILQSLADIEGKDCIDQIRPLRIRLQDWLENLSPLDWESTQWSNLRYAFIYLREFSMIGLV